MVGCRCTCTFAAPKSCSLKRGSPGLPMNPFDLRPWVLAQDQSRLEPPLLASINSPLLAEVKVVRLDLAGALPGAHIVCGIRAIRSRPTRCRPQAILLNMLVWASFSEHWWQNRQVLPRRHPSTRRPFAFDIDQVLSVCSVPHARERERKHPRHVSTSIFNIWSVDGEWDRPIYVNGC